MRKTQIMFMVGFIGLLLCQYIPINVKALTVLNSSVNLERTIPTNLNYGFPNGTFLVYQQDMSGILNVSVGSPPMYVEESQKGYEMNIISTTNKTDNTNTFVRQRFHNNTNSLSSFLNINDFDYDGIDVATINNSVISLMQGQFVYPMDVYPKDLMGNDSTFYILQTTVMGTGNPMFQFIELVEMLTNNQSLIDNGNITINELSNETITNSSTPLSNSYNFNKFVNITVSSYNDGEGGDGMQNMTIYGNITMGVNGTMNRFHIFDVIGMQFGIDLIVQSIVDPNMNGSLYEIIDAQFELVQSSLATSPEIQNIINNIASNWIAYTIGLVLLGGLLITSLIIQRRNCKDFTHPLDHAICRVGKTYKQ